MAVPQQEVVEVLYLNFPKAKPQQQPQPLPENALKVPSVSFEFKEWHLRAPVNVGSACGPDDKIFVRMIRITIRKNPTGVYHIDINLPVRTKIQHRINPNAAENNVIILPTIISKPPNGVISIGCFDSSMPPVRIIFKNEAERERFLAALSTEQQ